MYGDKNFEGKSQDYIYRVAIDRAATQINDEINDGNPGIGKTGKGKYSFGEGLEGSSTLPYFMTGSAERYHGPTKFLGVREGVKGVGLEAYLINPKTRVVQSDRLERIAKGEEEMPRIIYEIAKKWNYEESWVLEKLLEAENARRAERKKSKVEASEPSEEEKNLKNTAQQVSSAVRYPYDQNCRGIVQLYGSAGGNCHPDNLLALGLVNGINPVLLLEGV